MTRLPSRCVPVTWKWSPRVPNMLHSDLLLSLGHYNCIFEMFDILWHSITRLVDPLARINILPELVTRSASSQSGQLCHPARFDILPVEHPAGSGVLSVWSLVRFDILLRLCTIVWGTWHLTSYIDHQRHIHTQAGVAPFTTLFIVQ